MRVPIEELIDPERLAASSRDAGREPTRRQVQAALPAGWVLDRDGRTAHRDARVMFREGWVLACGLVLFGAAGLGLFWHTFPSGWSGLARFATLIAILILIGGVVAPIISRAVYRRS